MENLFSRQPFICVCVFVPPGSVLQISQLCETLTRVESTRFLRQICVANTHRSDVSFSLCCLHLISPLSLLLSSPQSPGTLHPPSLCLNGEHHSRTNDAPLLCSMLPSSASAWLHFHTRGESMTAKRQLGKR